MKVDSSKHLTEANPCVPKDSVSQTIYGKETDFFPAPIHHKPIAFCKIQ